MAYLIRMIARSKWKDINTETQTVDYPSHPITVDLKTSVKNELSVWRAEDLNEEKTVENIAISLCVARDEIKKVEMLALPEDQLRETGFHFINRPESARTVPEFKHLHYDLIDLKYQCVGNFAKKIVENLNEKTPDNKELFIQYSRVKLIDLIKKRINEKEIDISFFRTKEDMWEDLKLTW